MCWHAGCELAYVSELSGHVTVMLEYMQTTNPKIYAAGDVRGIEEASSAMVEGRLAGISAALSLGYGLDTAPRLREYAMAELNELRAGPSGDRIRRGIEKAERMAAEKALAKC